MAKSMWYDWGHEMGAEYAAMGLDPDAAPDPLSGEWAGLSIPEIFNHPDPPEHWLDDFEEGYYDAVYGNPTRRNRMRRRIQSLPAARRSRFESSMKRRKKPSITRGNPAEGGIPLGEMRRIETESGMVIEGNPEEITLHEALSAVSDWMDYESEVVEQAAEELEDQGETELARAAEEQSDAMEEAAEAVAEAADEAREAAAVAFSEEGTPAAEIAAEDSSEGEVVGGNPEPLEHGVDTAWEDLTEEQQEALLLLDRQWDEGNLTEEAYARGVRAIVRGNPEPPPVPAGEAPGGEVPQLDIPPESTHWYDRPLVRRG